MNVMKRISDLEIKLKEKIEEEEKSGVRAADIMACYDETIKLLRDRYSKSNLLIAKQREEMDTLEDKISVLESKLAFTKSKMESFSLGIKIAEERLAKYEPPEQVEE